MESKVDRSSTATDVCSTGRLYAKFADMNLPSLSSNTSPVQFVYQFDDGGSLLSTNLPFPVRRGKVRDVYDLGNRLLIVSTDRISAFDYVLPSGIPGKGQLLTEMSQFWFSQIDDGLIRASDDQSIRHHYLSGEVPDEVAAVVDPGPLKGRIMVTLKAEVIPFECVVRGYLEGSGLREYQHNGKICGIDLPSDMQQCDRFPEPIFTPATKAESGHDENVSFDVMSGQLGQPLAERLSSLSLSIYRQASEIALRKGILIADTKFEFGHYEGNVILIDEVLTPDSSRFWDAELYQPGRPQPSLDKQFVREFLLASDWDRTSIPPPLPMEIIEKTASKYRQACERLTN
jgi:phosphoribosylaminoimidazole-succinocarboxamide synthase